MALNYKKLGQYLRLVDVRNSDLSIVNLQGVSIEKRFIPSIANIIGTDLSTYKIVRTGQFAYGPVTSRNGDKISIALLDGPDCIISSSYISFEINNKEELLPEYLMLWFMRPEFDRYARYMSNGSAREVFDWETMCEVELPVPSIEEQLRIINGYKAISARKKVLKSNNEKIYEIANCIFKANLQKYDDFKELPLTELFDVQYGKYIYDKNDDGNNPVYSAGGIVGYKKAYQYDCEKLIVGCRGTCGELYVTQKHCSITPNSLILNLKMHDDEIFYFYFLMKNYNVKELITGSVQAQITIDNFIGKNVSFSNNHFLKLNAVCKNAVLSMLFNDKEVSLLDELEQRYLSTISKGEIRHAIV